MSTTTTSDATKAVVRRNTEEVQGGGNFVVFEELFADVMRVHNGKMTDHWGVGNLLSLMQQIGGWTPPNPS